MTTRVRLAFLWLCIALVLVSGAVYAEGFKVGFGKRDITPTKPVPMWGYGARHALGWTSGAGRRR